MRIAVIAALTLVSASACSRRDDAQRTRLTSAATTSGAPNDGANGASAHSPAVVLDMVDGFESCTLGHRGVLLDLGDPTMRARVTTGQGQGHGASLPVRELEGGTWSVVHDRALTLAFTSPEEVKPEAGITVEARVRGGLAKRMAIHLGGKPVGVVALAKGETQVVAVRSTAAAIARGANEVSLRFSGGPRAPTDPLAEVDWVRVGPSDGDAPYAAPTRSDALTTVSLGGVARRGLSLRAPGFARCAGYLPDDAVFEAQVGVAGGGAAEAEVRVLVDRAEPRTVATLTLGAPREAGGWRKIAIPLGAVQGIGAVELVAKSTAKGGRIVFGEPRVVAPTLTDAGGAAEMPASRGVVLVVLGSTPRRALAPWGGSIAVPELQELGASGVVFESHRAPSGMASAALASILTGVSPRRHGMLDADAPLPKRIPTIAEAARQAGVVSAMFTANPTTSRAFGFARGWETFAERSPNDDEPATALFEDAGRWLEAHKSDRFFVVVHARGGHPPWDPTNEELRDMAPEGYSGSLDPKHAGEMLAKARRPGSGRLTDADRTRAFALHAQAVGAHDAALGRLVAHLRAIGRADDTTVIVTSDIGVDTAANVPFLDDDTLEENALALPLVIRSPGVPAARVSSGTSSVDLARTVLDALGLPPPSQLDGESLWSTSLRAPAAERPAIAAAGARFSARWGGFVLVGTREREGKLCHLALEPDCVSDVRATHPIAAEVMHALLYDEVASMRAEAKGRAAPAAMAPYGRAPRGAKVAEAPAPAADAGAPELAAALRAWGR